MSNVAQNLVALMNVASAGLSDAVKVGKKLESEIFATILSVTTVSAYRVGNAINQGATAEEKDKKWAHAFAEFQNHFIAAGNAVFRDSEGLQEFRNIKTAIRKGEAVSGTLVRAYIGACREGKLTKKEHAIAEVQAISKKLHEDVAKNHPDMFVTLAAIEELADMAAAWDKFVRENYAGSYIALKAALSGGGAGSAAKTEQQKLDAAVKLLTDLTDAAELTAIIGKLNARLNEMTGVSAAALATMAAKDAKPVLPGQDADNDTVESDAAYTDRVAA